MAEVPGCDLELLRVAQENGDRALISIQEAVEDYGADVHAKEGGTGKTALHYAVSNGNAKIVEYLLTKGAKVDVKDKTGKTPIALALEQFKPDVMDFFITRGLIKPSTPVTADILLQAAELNNSTEPLKFLLEKVKAGLLKIDVNYHSPRQYQRTALHVAAGSKVRGMCELLLNAGAKLEEKDSKGQTPLFRAAEERQAANVTLLLRKGASVEPTNTNGYTSFHRACIQGDIPTVEAFFSNAPANIDLKELPSATRRETPLFSACKGLKAKMVKHLVERYKVNMVAQDMDGDTPLHLVCGEKVSEEKRTPRMDTLKTLLDLGCPINPVNAKGKTPIFNAVRTDKDLVEVLVSRGANLKHQDPAGYTPLHCAVQLPSPKEAQAVVAALLQGSLDLDQVTRSGETPAELTKEPEILSMLAKYSPPPPPPAPAPKLAPVSLKPALKKSPAPVKRKENLNEILVDGEGDEEADFPLVKSTSSGSEDRPDKRPKREHSFSPKPPPASIYAPAPSLAPKGKPPAPYPAGAVSNAPPKRVDTPTISLPDAPPLSLSSSSSSGAGYIGYEPKHSGQTVVPEKEKEKDTPPVPSSSLSSSAAPPSPLGHPAAAASSPYVNLRPDGDPMDLSRLHSLGPLIEHSELKLGAVIGEGAFGSVRHGEWNMMSVAVKILHKSDQKATTMFYKEVELFNKIRHKHIARYLGTCIQPPLCMVMEFYPDSLMNRIAGRPLDLPSLLFIAHGIALALLHLHSRKIIHRDVKPSNILLDEFMNPYVADFGVSREYGHTATMTGIGTPLYMAPEMLTTKKYSEKVDQYAFAMLLWQMLTGKPLSKGFDDEEEENALQIAFRAATQHCRPKIPVGIPDKLRQLLEACWDKNAEARPAFDQVASVLAELMKQYPRRAPSAQT